MQSYYNLAVYGSYAFAILAILGLWILSFTNMQKEEKKLSELRHESKA